MGVTLKEIAALAGVHRSTVDKVLHNRPGVSEAVRKKVQAILDETGYRPNPAGRALQKQAETIRLAAILLEVDACSYLQQGIRNAIDALAMYHIEVVFWRVKFGDVEAQVKQIRQAIAQHVDGIIVSPLSADPVRSAIAEATAGNVPVVTINTDISDTDRLCYVGQDAQKASRIAGRVLAEILDGNGEIAIVTSSDTTQNNNYFLYVREKEMVHYLEQHYPAIRVAARVESHEDPETTYAMTKEVLHQKPDLRAIYVTCGGVAEVGRALCDAGKARQTKLICYENYPEILALLRQDVVTCTINSNIVRQGEISVEVLIDYFMQDVRPADCIFTANEILFRECL